MFRWINNQGVESSDGFIFQRVDRYSYHYIQKDRKLRIDVEPLRDSDGGYYEEVYMDPINKWSPPYESELIDSKRISKIKSDITDALNFMKIKHSIR